MKYKYAPVAQLDRASDYGSEGCEFESLRVYELKLNNPLINQIIRLTFIEGFFSDLPIYLPIF